MTMEFRCEKCGKLVNADGEPGTTVRCLWCHKRVAIPSIVGSMPFPRMPDNIDTNQGPGPGTDPTREELMTQAGEGAVVGALACFMPWVISVFFHVGLALVMMFIVLVAIVKRDPVPLTVPHLALTKQASLPMAGSLTPSLIPPTQDRIRNDAAGYTDKDSSISEYTGDTDKPLDSRIGLGPDGPGGGTLAPWGPDRVGPPDFIGTTPKSLGNIHHVVYVIDRSGSMIDTFDSVRQELLLSISRLQPVQDFHVILFAKGTPMEPLARRLMSATRTNKELVVDFLVDIRPSGRTDPVPAIKRAFQVLARADARKPGKLILLLTDGNFPDNQAVLSAVRSLNKDNEVHVNTYLYGSRPPEAEKVMKKIAAENLGFYKFARDE